MNRPHSYSVRFVTGIMDPKAEVAVTSLEVIPDGYDLVLRQHAPLPDNEEGRLSREMLHKLIDAWLDGVEFKE